MNMVVLKRSVPYVSVFIILSHNYDSYSSLRSDTVPID